MNQKWTPFSWKDKTALHQPNYLDEKKLDKTVKKMKKLPPLVFAGEVRNLKKNLQNVWMVMVFCFKQEIAQKVSQSFTLIILEIHLES